MGSEALRPQLAREHQVDHALTPGDSNIVQPHSKMQRACLAAHKQLSLETARSFPGKHVQWKHDKQPEGPESEKLYIRRLIDYPSPDRPCADPLARMHFGSETRN